jgi:hypothetical protein
MVKVFRMQQRWFWLVVCWLMVSACTNPVEQVIPYIPEVTFTGYFNANYDSLAGNRQWPNTCRLIGDTVRIYCYSTTFSEVNRIREGDLLRIDLFPDSGNGFEKRNTLFHLARYHGQNESYTINRGDSADITIRFESEVVSYAASVNAPLELDEIFVRTPPLGPGQHLEILKGHLWGRVHR